MNTDAFLWALIEHSPAALVAVTPDGRIHTWNAAAERLFGYLADEIKGRPISLLVPDELLLEQHRHLEMLRRGEVIQVDTVRCHRDGRRLNIHMSAGPVRGEDGSIIGVAATLLDSEELHAARDIAEAARRRHAFLLHLGDETRKVSDPREIQLTACRMLAHELAVARVYYAEYAEDESRLSIAQQHHGSMPSLAGQWRIDDFGLTVARRFRAGETVVIRDVKADPGIEPEIRDAYASFEIRACIGVPLVRHERLRAMLAVLDVDARNWTAEEIALIEEVAERTWEPVERGRAEIRLRQSEDQLSSSLRIETVGVIYFSAEGPILQSNLAFQLMSGYSEEEIAAGLLTWKDLTPPEFHDVSLNAIQELTTRGYTTPYEKQYIRKDGSRWWGLFAARRLPDGTGVEYIIDVTERRDLENSLREADRRKDEFLATLGHELRNPLAPIRNGLQIVRTAGRHDSLISSTVEMMERQVNHLVHLVDDLLDLGRITAGKIELRRKFISLNELARTSVEATRVFIDARGHQIDIEMPDEEVMVNVDRDRMTQVIANLLSNSAKYTDEGGRITLRLSVEHGTAAISVADNGIGIPAEDLDHVFDLFSQVRIHQGRSEGGLGIGLSLVKSLVTMHGGTVRAFSKGSGRGSTFTVELPLAVDMQPEVSEEPADDEDLESAQGHAILIADDNIDSAQSLAMLLSLEGHEVATAFDGAEVLEKMSVVHPDIVILDLGMPRMNGLEAARRIRQLPEGDTIKLIALTGWGQQSDRQRTLEHGFDHHLVKPLDMQELNAIIGTRASMAAGSASRGAIV